MTIKKPLVVSTALFMCTIILLSSFTNKTFVSQGSVAIQYQKDTVPDDQDSVFAKVEIEASFPGGDKAWRSFLEKNLSGDVPAKKKAPAGIYTVVIQFVVDSKGKISDIKALTNHGYGMEEEVIRVIKLAPRWVPAWQKDHYVRAYRNQPVTFQIEEEKKKRNRNRD